LLRGSDVLPTNSRLSGSLDGPSFLKLRAQGMLGIDAPTVGYTPSDGWRKGSVLASLLVPRASMDYGKIDGIAQLVDR
jgi:hypothetical protein